MDDMQEYFKQLRFEFAQRVKTVSDMQELQELESEYAARIWDAVVKYIHK